MPPPKPLERGACVHRQHDTDREARRDDQRRGTVSELKDMPEEFAGLYGGRAASTTARPPNVATTPTNSNSPIAPAPARSTSEIGCICTGASLTDARWAGCSILDSESTLSSGRNAG